MAALSDKNAMMQIIGCLLKNPMILIKVGIIIIIMFIISKIINKKLNLD